MAEKELKKAYINKSYIISSLGFGVDENVKSILNKKTNYSLWNNDTPICLINHDRLQGLVNKYSLQNYSKLVSVAVSAIYELLSRDKDIYLNKNTKLILSTTKGNIHLLSNHSENDVFLYNNAKDISSILGLSSKPIVISNACVSGVSALIYAKNLVEEGECENVIVLGIDFLSDFVIKGFNSFKSLSKNICRPYQQERDGLTLGEACATVLVSTKGDVLLAGGSISSDANHISGPSRTGDALAYAMDSALKEAGITPSGVDFVNMHGTATIYNDEMESKAINLAGLLDSPVNSLKPYLGHTLGASGIIESILCCEQMKMGLIFGVKDYKNSGTPFNLNISSTDRNSNIKICVKTASGFGGSNAALVLSLEDKTQNKWAYNINYKIINSVTNSDADLNKLHELSFSEFIKLKQKDYPINIIKFSKMDNLSKLGCLTASELLKDIDLGENPYQVALIMANKSSSLDTDIKHQFNIEHLPTEEVSPSVFVYTLANIVSGEISIAHKIKGECTFFIDENYDEEFLNAQALRCLRKGAKYVIYGWCELLGEKFNVNFKLLEKI